METVQDVIQGCFVRSTCLDEKRHEAEVLEVEIEFIVQRVTIGLGERIRSDQSRRDAEWGHDCVFLAVFSTGNRSAISKSSYGNNTTRAPLTVASHLDMSSNSWTISRSRACLAPAEDPIDWIESKCRSLSHLTSTLP
jgi:hypothetical protein